MGDWISCASYGRLQTVPIGQNAVFPLLTMPLAGTYDAAQPYGGPGALSTVFDGHIERIVGQVYQAPDLVNPPPATLWGWRLLELPWDFDAANFDVPWQTVDQVLLDPTNTDIVRWYAERWYQTDPLGGFVPGLDPVVSHPWWTFVDVKPNASVGAHSRMWPCLCVDNTGGTDALDFVHRLRMYGEWRTR